MEQNTPESTKGKTDVKGFMIALVLALTILALGIYADKWLVNQTKIKQEQSSIHSLL
jgi:hypothetical protein